MFTDLLKKLSQDYKNLVKNSEFTDISIQVGEEFNKAYFYAYSLILRTRSSYFWEVLSKLGDNIEPRKDAHELNLKELCNYIENIIIKEKTLKHDFYQKIYPFYKAFDSKFYIQILEIYTFNNNQKSSTTNEPFDNLSNSPSAFSILPNQAFKKSAIHTNDIKLPISDFGNTATKSSANIVSTATKVTDIIFTIIPIHGYSSKKFYAQYDNKGSTLLILRVKDTNEILGRYNLINWYKEMSKNIYYETSTSFIFFLNLQNLDNSIVSKVIDTKYAIRQNRYAGPSFGKNDLKICGKLKENKKSRCRKSSYKKPIRDNTKFFSVDDYEVFKFLENLLYKIN
ncbi:BTB-domain-containing protein [Gigaspora margarita]|uniref:BTB-domain-containing protein n=1 Tax=Gigaspora margarita TaxID=4874 RepID=A0A8H3XA17_GIGMA|nr:BTB-domain-containing protein [Gigaspora margarita]